MTELKKQGPYGRQMNCRKELKYLQAQLKQMNESIDSERGKLQRGN